MKAIRPSELELQFLSLLWRKGPLTAREVLDALPDGKRRAYTTVLSVLQVMEKKGLLTHTTRGPANVYKPKVSRRQVLGPLLRDLVRNVFGGRPSEAVLHLVQENDVTAEELKEMRRILDEQ